MTTPSAEQALPGQLGDFAIVGVLGTGGSGVVLDARWGHREVALKVLHPTLIATERERAQFLEEARRLQEISHPGVVKVLASGELPDGRPYLAMEKLAGPTLAAKLAHGALPLTRALALFEQLAGAVQALHDRGLIHRDLKPENVVLVGDAHAVLLDFGIAKALAAPASTTTQDGGVRGTPAYMAPERFFGQPASIATDVYELAVTLYAMLAGTLPWADCGDVEVRLNPASLGDAVPEALDVEIRRALSTRGQNRPASARELAAGVLGAAGMPVGPISSRTTAQVPLDVAARQPAWFEQRTGAVATGDDKGQTPLAWAPTAHQRRRDDAPGGVRRWWPIAAAIVAVVAAVVGYIIVRSDDDGPSAGEQLGAVMTGTEDPWAPRDVPASDTDPVAAEPTGTSAASGFVATAAPRPIGEMRTEMIAAVRRLPADTRTVLALAIAEMRADKDFGAILEAAVERPEVNLMFGRTDKCEIGVADIDWIVLGFREPGVHRQGEAVIRGRWTHEQLEHCLATLADGKPEVDPGTGMVKIKGSENGFWVGHAGSTAVISSRDDGTAAHVAALLAREAGPTGATGALIAKLERDATLWLVVDADDADEYDLGLPPGGDFAGWARIDNGLKGRIIGRFRTEADTRTAFATMQTKVAEAKKEAGDLMGKFDVELTDGDIVLVGWLTPLTMGIAAGQISAM